MFLWRDPLFFVTFFYHCRHRRLRLFPLNFSGAIDSPDKLSVVPRIVSSVHPMGSSRHER